MNHEIATKATGIVEVKRPALDDANVLEHCGMAILITARHALTAAHVVNAALYRRLDHPDPPGPGDTIRLSFPLMPAGALRTARIVRWINADVGVFDDLALLEMDEAAPPEAGIAILAYVPAITVDAGPWSAYGIAGIGGVGHHVLLKLQGDATAAWRQVNAVGSTTIEPGFSGGGVWDEGHQATIGMVVRRAISNKGIAYFVPTSALTRFAKGIPYECRTLSPLYSRVFTVLGGLFFFAALFHMLGDRIREFPPFLTLGLGNEILSAFWGLHILVFGLPVLLWAMLRFARAFREHPWWMRVPQLGFMGAPARPAMSRTAAVLTLLMLVGLPLYMEGHFLRRLHDPDTRIYINADVFGFKPGALKDCGPGEGGGYCGHDQASLYGLVKPAPGAEGGYLNNAYHIGNHDRALTRDTPTSVTFFPILQPLILIALAAASGLLAARLLWRLRRPARRTLNCYLPLHPEQRIDPKA